jgi:hypothetical protein
MPLSNVFPRFTALMRRLRPHRPNGFRRAFTSVAAIAAVATVGTSALLSPLALADQVDNNHDALVKQFIQQQHASPLAADCAAHAAFVVPTSPDYDHVAFLSTALDSQHANIEPWGKPFNNHKQRITVDNIVTVNGLGYRKNAGERTQPDLLELRCGYVADKLLAFSYKEAEVGGPPAAAAPAVRSSRAERGGGRQKAVKRQRGGKASSTSTRRGTAKHTTSKRTSASSHH